MNRQHVTYQTLLLGATALLVSSVLAVSDHYTGPAIAERQSEDLRASLTQVVSPDLYDNDLLKDTLSVDMAGQPVTVYRARKSGQVTALVFTVIGKGYAGPIRVLLGVDRDGKVLGARVLAHTETPGLGDKIELAKDDWILAFDGLALGAPPVADWAVRKDGGRFDQFTGATITPRAVVNAIKGGLEWFDGQRPLLLDLAPATAAVTEGALSNGN